MLLRLILYAIAFSSLFFAIGLAAANPSGNLLVVLFVLVCSVILGSFMLFIKSMSERIFPGDARMRAVIDGTLIGAVALATPFLALKVVGLFGKFQKDQSSGLAVLALLFIMAVCFVIIGSRKLNG